MINCVKTLKLVTVTASVKRPIPEFRQWPGLLVLDSLRRTRQETLPRIDAETPKEILEKMEVENAILVGEMITRCVRKYFP